MYQYFLEHPLLAFIFILIGVFVILYLTIKAAQKVGLERIQAEVYKAILNAEHEFNYGDNTQKFEYVVGLARSHLPSPFNMIITESLLRGVIQMWFDLVKDLLDDGKLNKKQED